MLQQLSKKVQDTLAKANEVAEEVTSSMRTVRSFANETNEAERYAGALHTTYVLMKKEAVVAASYMSSTQVSVIYPLHMNSFIKAVPAFKPVCILF